MIAVSEASAHSRPEHPDRGVDAPLLTADIPIELARLRSEHGYEVEGHAGRTLTKNPDLRVVLEAMKPGVHQRLHATGERMTLQVLVGQLRVRTERGEDVVLSQGGFTAIDAEGAHEIYSLFESAFLLTLAWPPGRGEVSAARQGSDTGI